MLAMEFSKRLARRRRGAEKSPSKLRPLESDAECHVKGAEEGMGEEPLTLVKLGRRPSSRPKPKAKRRARFKPKDFPAC